MIVIGLIVPFRPHFNTAFIKINVPELSSVIEPIIPNNIEITPYEAADSYTAIQAAAGEGLTITVYHLAGCLWIIGVITVMAYNMLRHRRFIKMVNRWSDKITNYQLCSILQELKDDMEISKPVELRLCHSISSPMLFGFFRHVILLPSAETASDKLELILKHELVHLKRNDLWYKVMVLLAAAIHWFNPMVYIMAKAIAVECEISCDEQVLQGTSAEQREQYSETIIDALRNGAKLKTVLSTDFFTEGKTV